MIDFLWFILDAVAWFMTIIGILLISVVMLVIAGVAGLFGVYEMGLRGEDNGSTGPKSQD